jgi:hypothetical protein
MFKKIIGSVFFLAMLTLMWSCSGSHPKSSYLQEKITKENLYDLANKIKQENKMTKEDAELFVGAINRLGLQSDSIVGKTVEQLIKEQDNFIRLSSYNLMISTFAKAEMLMEHKIKYLGLKPMDTLGKSYDYLVFEIKNEGNKNITDITGQLRFFTNANQIVKAYPIELNKVLDGNVIKPNETRRFVYPFFHDKDNQRDELIRSGKDLQVLWFPVSMTFSDSSKISSEVK